MARTRTSTLRPTKFDVAKKVARLMFGGSASDLLVHHQAITLSYLPEDVLRKAQTRLSDANYVFEHPTPKTDLAKETARMIWTTSSEIVIDEHATTLGMLPLDILKTTHDRMLN